MTTNELELSVRPVRILKELEITAIEQLLHKDTWEKLRNKRSCGKRTLLEIKIKMQEYIDYLALGP